LWSAEGTGDGSLESVGHGCFHGSSDLNGESLDDDGDVRI
jgi:hypothetical protein